MKYPLEIAMSLLRGRVCPYQVGKNTFFFLASLHSLDSRIISEK